MLKKLNNKNHIYKFYRFNLNLIKTLVNAELWFGEPKNQNDPYEAEFIIKGINNKLSDYVKLLLIKLMYPNDNIDLIKEIYKNDLENRNLIADYSKFIKKEIKKDFGICSFSKNCDDILLWSHYADGHKGLCLVFDKNKLHKNLIDQRTVGEDIQYATTVPHLNVELDEKGMPWINGYDQLNFKYQKFIGEDEYRYIRYFDPKFSKGAVVRHEKLNFNNKSKSLIRVEGKTIKNRNVKFDKSTLQVIIFGENMDNDNKRSIVNLVRSITDYNHVQFFCSKKNFEEQKMRIEVIHEKHSDYYDLLKDQGATKNLFL